MLVDDEEHALSERLEGIVDALVMRTAVLVASKPRERLTPSELDELRALVRVGIRGAAIEGSRRADLTYRTLIDQRERQTDPGWNKNISERIHLKKTVKMSPDGVF